MAKDKEEKQTAGENQTKPPKDKKDQKQTGASGTGKPPADNTQKTGTKADTTKKDEGTFPNTQEEFAEELKAFKVPNEVKISEYVAGTGDLDNVEHVDKALAEMGVDINKRKPFIKYWFGTRKINIPEDVQKRLDAASADKNKESIEEAGDADRVYTVDTVSGLIRIIEKGERGVSLPDARRLKELREKSGEQPPSNMRPLEYVYDAQARVIRFAGPNERGGTLDEATKLKSMAAEGGDADDLPEFLLDANQNWIPNPDPKVKHTKAGFYAAMMLMRAQSQGQPYDPIDGMIKLAALFPRETPAPPQPQTPTWMNDPAQLKSIFQQPAPVQDPQMAETLRTMSAKIDKMEEEKHQNEMLALQKQIADANAVHEKSMSELKQLIASREGRSSTGKTEIDVLDNVTENGLGFIKQEGAGWREFFNQMFANGNMPGQGGVHSREQQREVIREAVKKDEDIERLTKEIYQ